MICEWCRCVFCWDGADEGAFGGDRKLYCSDTCDRGARRGRQRRRQRRQQRQLQMCLERPKPAYPDERAALDAIARLGREPPLYPYECACGAWHLTSQQPELAA